MLARILRDAWLWLFLIIALISCVIFGVLTFDSLKQIPQRTNAWQLSEEVVAGKKAFQKYNCNDCHTFFGIGGYYAPDLTKIYKKYGDSGRDLLKDIIMNPENYFGGKSKSIFDFGRRMQKPHLKKNVDGKLVKKFITENEADRIIDYLKWASEIDNNDWPPAYSDRYKKNDDKNSNSSKGMSLLESKNCLLCHKYGGLGGKVGPVLNSFSIRRRFIKLEELKNFIREPGNPRYGDKDSLMPPYGNAEFTEEELDELVEFLWENKE